MASIHRGLKPGGRVILVDFRRIPGKSTERVLNHVRADQEVFVSEVVQSGFRITRKPENLLTENYFVEFTKGSSPRLKHLEFPLITAYGGVVKVPNAVEKPRLGVKVVFDVTADAKLNNVNKGLERAAHLVNLYGAAALKADDVRITVVVHGNATKSVLNHDFFRPRFHVDQNPNISLIRELKKAGIDVLVCGLALNYEGFPGSAVINDVSVADATLAIIVNRQTDGYVYAPVP
jgi:intracellular sulfur oxidation DsrE/DsrF family protein